jgi:uncharacterized repeat protein (TIGR03943 family)
MLLCGIGLVATLALAAAGDLALYIHPRYIVFTVVLSVVGLVLFGLAVWMSVARPEHEHEHEHHDHEHDHVPRGRTVTSVASVGLVVLAAFALLIAPPTTLSAERALTATSAAGGGADLPAPVLVGSDPTRFSIRDWATILGTGSTANDLVGQRADVTGIVLVDGSGTARIGRYAVTCCTVDAQLFAVPVDRSTLPPGVQTGAWVHVTGTFADADGATRLVAESAEEVAEPDDPYLS